MCGGSKLLTLHNPPHVKRESKVLTLRMWNVQVIGTSACGGSKVLTLHMWPHVEGASYLELMKMEQVIGTFVCGGSKLLETAYRVRKLLETMHVEAASC